VSHWNNVSQSFYMTKHWWLQHRPQPTTHDCTALHSTSEWCNGRWNK